MRNNQYLGRGNWAEIVLHICYMYSMHLTKSNLHSRNNLFQVIAYNYVNQIYLTSIFLKKHYFAQRKLPDAKLNHSGLLQSCGTRAWQPCAWSDQMKLRKRLAISQIVSTLMHTLFIDYDHFSTPNFKRKKSINPSIFRLGKYASIDHFVTDETDLKVTGQSLFCLFVA